jgi:phospholipid/cholesterol/gamma-HCH transport system substrate-binding protein
VIVALLVDTDERFKNLFGRAAMFVLLAALGIGVVFVWTGVKKDVFTAKSPIYFVADSGQDLSEGMPVKFSGFKIGSLNSLTLDEQGRVQVEVRIDKKYLSLIRQDAVMSLKKEGVIGDGILEISRGTEDTPALEPGNKVRFERASGLEQAVVDVKNRIIPILADLHHSLHDPDGDVRQTLKNLREFTAGLRDSQIRLGHALDKINTNLDREVEPMLQSMRKSAASAETMSGKLDSELPALLKNVESSVDSLRETSETINDAVKRAAPQLPAVMDETRETLDKTQKLIGGTQEAIDSLSTHWPLKSNAPPASNAPVKMDSHD